MAFRWQHGIERCELGLERVGAWRPEVRRSDGMGRAFYALVRQITGTVRWGASLLQLVASGANTLIDVGPDRVPTPLAREVVPRFRVRAADDVLAAPTLNHEREATP